MVYSTIQYDEQLLDWSTLKTDMLAQFNPADYARVARTKLAAVK